MSDVLTKICDDKRAHITAQKSSRSLADVEAAAKIADAPRGFAKQLTARSPKRLWVDRRNQEGEPQ